MLEPVTTALGLSAATSFLGGVAGKLFSAEGAAGLITNIASGPIDQWRQANWQQLRENLRRYRPDANHELQRELYRAWLQATLQICALRGEQLGINVDEWFRPHSLPRPFAAALSKLRDDAPLGVLSAAEATWLDAVSSDLGQQLDALGKGALDPPSKLDHAELESVLQQTELLLQPADAAERVRLLREAASRRALADLKQAYEQKCGETPEAVAALVERRWFDLLCGCFQHAVKHHPPIANAFQNALLVKMYVKDRAGRKKAITAKQLQAQFEQFGGDLAARLTRAHRQLLARQKKGFDLIAGRVDRLLPLLALAQDAKALLDGLPKLIQAETDRAIDATKAVGIQVEGVGEKIDDLRSMLQAHPSSFAPTAPEPLVTHLNPKEMIVDRERECAAVIAELRKPDGRRVLPIVAPGGFGKTRLIIKLLQEVTAEEQIVEPSVQRILTLDCGGGALSLARLFTAAERLTGRSGSFQRLHAEREKPLRQRLAEFFDELSRVGGVWIVLDNFEDLLEGDAVKDDEIRQFIVCCGDGTHRVRVLLTTRTLPQLDGAHRLASLPDVDQGLHDGLPPEDAVAYLRREGEDCGLRDADEQLLRDFARRVHFIPKALASVVGYLKDGVYPAVTLQDLMNDGALFSDFDRHDYERGLKRLLEAQLSRLTPEARMLLGVLAFFESPVPQPALDSLLPKVELARVMNRLCVNKLVDFQTDRFAVTRYSIHPSLRDHTTLKLRAIDSPINEKLAEACWNFGLEAWGKANFSLAADLFTCDEKICQHLISTGQTDLADRLAAALVGKGNVLGSLGQLSESISCLDEAIKTYKLIGSEGETRSAGNLAMALMNKGVSLYLLGQLDESMTCLNRAIETFRKAAKENGVESANNLAMALMNTGNVLCQLKRLDDAIAYYDEAIAIRSHLIVEGQAWLASDLAMTLVCKGNAFGLLEQPSQAVTCYDRAIETYENLITAGRAELASSLATTWGNKGIALKTLGRLSEANTCYDKAISALSQLVENGRSELANELAMIRINKANLLLGNSQREESFAQYSEAIRLWETCVCDQGMLHLLPLLLKAIRLRLSLLLALRQWADVARDVLRAFSLAGPLITAGALPGAAEYELGALIHMLRELSADDRAELYAAMGDGAEWLKRMIEG
jgi:tetratricopeptide (TPR) repeat protein